MTFPVPEGITPNPSIHGIPPQLQPTGPAAGQVEAWRSQFIEMILRQVVLALRGFFIPDATTQGAFTQLQTWVADIPILGDIVEVLTGVEDGNLNDLGTWVNTLLGINRPVPEIQAAAVVDTNPNLLLAPSFAATKTVVAGQGWTWDNTAGHDSIGCAKVVAAGSLNELVSNEIRVDEGQKMDLSVWVKWSGLTYTGINPVAVGVTRYLNFAEVGSDDLVFLASPAGTQDWTQLARTAYVVPSGCDQIRLRFKIDANLTAGTVFWDDASVTKSQPGSGYIGNFLDTTINGLENVNQPGWDLTDLLISMLNQFRTTADHASRITLLEALNSPGNKINDEFFRVGTTLGANWNETYIGSGAGTWETDGDFAFWNKNGVGTLDVRCRYIGTPSTTLTDNQKVIAILGSKAEVGFLPSIIGLLFVCESHMDLYGRMDTTETNWIRARFSATGDVFIHRSIAGVVTELAHTENYDPIFTPTGNQPPGAGATIALICGTSVGARFFEAQIDGRVVCEANDTTSNVGASYRGYGHGARSEGSILILGQAAPSKFNAWAAVDN